MYQVGPKMFFQSCHKAMKGGAGAGAPTGESEVIDIHSRAMDIRRLLERCLDRVNRELCDEVL